MPTRRTAKLDPQLYRIIDQRVTSDRARARRRILKRVLEDNDALGLIEWWERGSIVKKPRSHFYAVMIVDKPSNESTHASPDVSKSEEV